MKNIYKQILMLNQLFKFKIFLLAFILSGGLIYAQSGKPGSGQPWKTFGNVKVDESINFLGTSVYQDLRIRTNDIQRMVITKDGLVGIGVPTPLYKVQVDGDIVPSLDLTYDLGKPSLRWKICMLEV